MGLVLGVGVSETEDNMAAGQYESISYYIQIIYYNMFLKTF